MFTTQCRPITTLLPTLAFSTLLATFGLAFPELSVKLRFQAVPELEQLVQSILVPAEKRRRTMRDQQHRQKPIGIGQVPLAVGNAELGFFIEFQRDEGEEEEEEAGEDEKMAMAEQIQVDEPMPKLSAQYDYFGPGAGGRINPFGGNPYGTGAGETVNFDFQCKCQAKSALARTLNSQLPSDPNQAAQQQIQQLQEQVRKLQEQINRSQQGKSSFEQFAQMLSMADGLDCSCSGQSTPWSGWPSGVSGAGNPFGAGGRFTGGGGPLSQAGMGGGGGHFPMPSMMGAGGGMMPMGGRPMGGGQFGGAGQLYPGGYPILAGRV